MDQPQDNTTVDLNRSLPSLPLNLCLDLPPNISFNPTSEAVKRHERLTSSTSSTSASSGKQQFQNLTRDLLHSSDTESPSPTCDPPDHFDPVKYNPSDRSPESPTMPSAYVTFFLLRSFFVSSFAFRGQRYQPITELSPTTNYQI